MTQTIQIFGNIANLPSGSRSITESINLLNPIDQTLSIILSAGANLISIPAGASIVLLTPNPSELVASTFSLKNISSDSGFPINTKQSSLLSLGNQTSFIINSTATMSLPLEIVFL